MLRKGTRIEGARRCYLLEDRLAGGAHGELWRARDDRGRRWVVKLAHRGFTGELQTELASASERGRGEGWTGRVVAIADQGVVAGRPFLVQPEYDGDLAAWLRRRPPFERRLEALRLVASAVGCLERGPRVHRDLKPENFLVREVPFEVVLADFGLARRRDDDLGQTGSGTRGYQPWDAMLNRGRRVSAASDAFALGVIAFELLTLCAPSAARSHERGLSDRGRELLALTHRVRRDPADEDARRRLAVLAGTPESALVHLDRLRALDTDDRAALEPVRALPAGPGLVAAVETLLDPLPAHRDGGVARLLAVLEGPAHPVAPPPGPVGATLHDSTPGRDEAPDPGSWWPG